MPSPDLNKSSITNEQVWVNGQRAVINQYSTKIESCIEGGAWQMLAFVLHSRECYLRDLYSGTIAAQFRPELTKLAEEILEHDKRLNEIVEAQKNCVRQKQLAVGRNKRALSTYDQANSY